MGPELSVARRIAEENAPLTLHRDYTGAHFGNLELIKTRFVALENICANAELDLNGGLMHTLLVIICTRP